MNFFVWSTSWLYSRRAERQVYLEESSGLNITKTDQITYNTWLAAQVRGKRIDSSTMPSPEISCRCIIVFSLFALDPVMFGHIRR